MDNIDIYVRLLDEQIDTWRPVKAKIIEENIYVIIDNTEDIDIEEWEFKNGDIVIAYEIHTKTSSFLAAIGKKKYFYLNEDGELRWKYEQAE